MRSSHKAFVSRQAFHVEQKWALTIFLKYDTLCFEKEGVGADPLLCLPNLSKIWLHSKIGGKIVKNSSKILCCLLAIMFCFSMMACSRQVVSESWISEEGESISNQQNGDANTDNDANKDADAGDAGNKDSNANKVDKNKGTTTKVTSASKKKNPQANIVYRNIVVKKSSTTLEDTVKTTFKGKTYKAINWSNVVTGAYAEELQAFAKKYGCTIKLDGIAFERVRETLAKALSAGDAYDLVRMHGSWYPRAIVTNLLAPLDGSFTTADLVTSSNQTGIDLEKSKWFGWGDKLYAVTTYNDTPLNVFIYNKKILKGADDPWTLYNKGQWTWAKLKELAVKYTDGTRYWSDQSCAGYNDVDYIKETDLGNGQIKLEVNLASNQNLINQQKFNAAMGNRGSFGGLYAKVGKQVIWKNPSSADYNNTDEWAAGNFVAYVDESNELQNVYKLAKSKVATALDRNPDNVGVAMPPLGPDNKSGAVGSGWLTGFSAGRGSDATAPKLVAAFCKFHSTYDATSSLSGVELEAYKWEKKMMAPLQKFYKNIYFGELSYGTADGNMVDLSYEWNAQINKGADIISTLKSVQSKAEYYLKNSLSYQ